jgi:ATP-dependent RNA helicase DDX60
MTIRNVLEQLLIKASREASRADDSVDEDLEIDSGYGTLDPAENDLEEGQGSSDDGFKRPKGVIDLDWKVYEVVDGALREFEEKYKAMWA